MMRQKIAEHMVFSKHTSAHVTTVHKADMTAVAKLRDKLKGQFQAQYGIQPDLPAVRDARGDRGSAAIPDRQCVY